MYKGLKWVNGFGTSLTAPSLRNSPDCENNKNQIEIKKMWGFILNMKKKLFYLYRLPTTPSILQKKYKFKQFDKNNEQLSGIQFKVQLYNS